MSSAYFSQTKQSHMIMNLDLIVFRYTSSQTGYKFVFAFLYKNRRIGPAIIQCKHKLFKEQVYPWGMAVKVEDEVRDHRGLS